MKYRDVVPDRGSEPGAGMDILLVDDDQQVRGAFGELLAAMGYAVQTAASREAAREAMAGSRFKAYILDLVLEDGSGKDLITDVRRASPEAVIIMVSGYGEIPHVVETMQMGADHFLTKPLDLRELKGVLEKKNVRRTQRPAAYAAPSSRGGVVFGRSARGAELGRDALLAAESGSAVLLTGETGTGKSVLARWIHDHSSRAESAFVEVNCSGLRGELLASELFGHARGAFTSASADRSGLLDAANGGTLFLDEIGDMDPGVQVRFLKVLEDKSYRRLGEVRTRTSDFRLICATNKDIVNNSAAAGFRRDLLFRIQVLPLALPSLRERPADIPALARHLLEELGYAYGDPDQKVLSLLMHYPWYGNIRELRNVLQRAVLLSKGEPLSTRDFPFIKAGLIPPASESGDDLRATEWEAIRLALLRHEGHVGKAAMSLGIAQSTLYRKLQKLKDQ